MIKRACYMMDIENEDLGSMAEKGSEILTSMRMKVKVKSNMLIGQILFIFNLYITVFKKQKC
ncbi:hypothetical protein BpHYR1_036572 [Brachionus plicatilis]|uniref:Uncharacterized protein n=1 Tax=Brachionus plicatilis TaxID=10195 RepID=A0A3M7PWN6_BRAPC|nr:hypothetical protein BpHYR1_036572 [Brachionus plicatilis]